MSTNPQTRTRLLAATIVALALVVGGLAGATIDRAIFRQTTQSPHAASQPAIVRTPDTEPYLMPDREPHPSRTRDLPAFERLRERMRAFDGPGPGMQFRSAPHSLDRLTRELDLSADQRARIEALLQEQQERMRGLRLELRERRGAIVAETRAGILELLTADQRARIQDADRARTRALGPVGRMLRETRGE